MRGLALAMTVALALGAGAPTFAADSRYVVCDQKVQRIVRALKARGDGLTAREAELGRQELFRAIENCRPVGSSGRTPEGISIDRPATSGTGEKVRRDTEFEARALRRQELTPLEEMRADQQLDRIRDISRTDPAQAESLLNQYQVEQRVDELTRKK